MKEQFTKGDWFTDEGGVLDASHLITTIHRSVENNIVPICEIETGYDGVIGQEQKANAHLIAAGPKMYRMLQGMADATVHNHNYETAKPIYDLLAEARGEKSDTA